MNMLGIIFVSVFFGVALSLLSTDEGCGNIIRGIESFNKVIIKMVRFQLVYIMLIMSRIVCTPLGGQK